MDEDDLLVGVRLRVGRLPLVRIRYRLELAIRGRRAVDGARRGTLRLNVIGRGRGLVEGTIHLWGLYHLQAAGSELVVRTDRTRQGIGKVGVWW